MPDTTGFDGKTVVVTGAASGIGAEAAKIFAARGANVVLADRNADAGREVVNGIEKNGGLAIFAEMDVRSSEQVAAMLDAAVDRFGRIDCAFNNAGTDGVAKSLHELTEEEWQDVFQVNVTGTWLCIKYEALQMLRQRAGAIVNTASALGLIGMGQMFGHYVASKHGVVGLTRAASLEYAGVIRVNAVCPGVVRTPMLESVIRQGRVASEEEAATLHPIGRVADPKEIAEAAVWLCSDAASFVTGHAMAVDGGWTAN